VHLQGAFSSFWEKRARYPVLRYPVFRSRKRSRAAAEYTRSAFRFRDGRLTLAKMTGPLAIVWSRPLPEGVEPTTVSVSVDPVGRRHVSMLVGTTIEALAKTGPVVGVDAWITGLLIADRRRDNLHNLHKLTTRLVRENRTVVIEDLQVRNMLGNHSLARAICEASWREFGGMLEDKGAWYGRDLVVVDRWYPSGRVCSTCGFKAARMPLDVREGTCTQCGTSHDRDVNAARNRRAEGLSVLACGDGVRPTRR
jgi:putative transposase